MARARDPNLTEKQTTVMRKRHPNSSQKSHGHSFVNGRETPEYAAWRSMKRRCLDPNQTNYPRYGGNGIKVCDQWINSFETFLADVGLRPTHGHSLDRLNNKGNYEPGNCRWATIQEQNRNRSSVRRVIFDGEITTLPVLADRFGIKPAILRQRLDRGWSLERAVRGDNA